MAFVTIIFILIIYIHGSRELYCYICGGLEVIAACNVSLMALTWISYLIAATGDFQCMEVKPDETKKYHGQYRK